MLVFAAVIGGGVGGVAGGRIMAYLFGRRHGDADAKMQQLFDWKREVEERLEKGSDLMVSIPVLEAKLAETSSGIALIREEMREGFAEVTRQFERGREIFVQRTHCDAVHEATRADIEEIKRDLRELVRQPRRRA